MPDPEREPEPNYFCEFDNCEFRSTLDEVAKHELFCKHRSSNEELVQKWSDITRKDWKWNEAVIEELKNEYSMEKALHETLNIATENLKQAVQKKESLKLTLNHKEPTAMKSSVRSNVANKRQRSIIIIKAMQSKASAKFKTEHWQKVHQELM